MILFPGSLQHKSTIVPANIVFFTETTDNSVTARSQISRAMVSPSSFTLVALIVSFRKSRKRGEPREVRP